MKRVPLAMLLVAIGVAIACHSEKKPEVFKIEEGFVESEDNVLIYYKTFGNGEPLVIVHGGPGASHDYFLPYLIPLAKTNRLIFIDERGSGRSTKLDDPSGYTVNTMVEDLEAVRVGLKLGKINLLGHSYGGVLAQAYALRYQDNLDHLILCSTFHSTKQLNAVFDKMKENMKPELRRRIEKMEQRGIFGRGKDYAKHRYSEEYMLAAWGEGYYPYLYGRRPDPNFDPLAMGNMSWDLYREMWGTHGEFVVDGNLRNVEYENRLESIEVPTLITVGDHDQVDPSISKDMQAHIKGSTLAILPDSGHMTFVDQPAMFIHTVDRWLKNSK